jgi:hypothetical protein
VRRSGGGPRSVQSLRGLLRFSERPRPHELPKRRGRIGHLVLDRSEVTPQPEEFAVARVFVECALQVPRIREHCGEPAVRREIERIERDRGPEERERRDRIPLA